MARIIVIDDYTVDLHDKFIVQNCKHHYGVNHTMQLELKRVTPEVDTTDFKKTTTKTVATNAVAVTGNASGAAAQVDAGMAAMNGYQSVYRDNGCVDVVVNTGLITIHF